MGRDKLPPALDECAQLLALLVGERRDVRQDEGVESLDMAGVQQAVVDHLERDSCFDQCLVPAEGVIFDFLARPVPP